MFFFFFNSKFSCSVICRSIRAAGRQGLEPGLCLPETRWRLCELGRVPPPLRGLGGLSQGTERGRGERRPAERALLRLWLRRCGQRSGRWSGGGASVGPVCQQREGRGFQEQHLFSFISSSHSRAVSLPRVSFGSDLSLLCSPKHTHPDFRWEC